VLLLRLIYAIQEFGLASSKSGSLGKVHHMVIPFHSSKTTGINQFFAKLTHHM